MGHLAYICPQSCTVADLSMLASPFEQQQSYIYPNHSLERNIWVDHTDPIINPLEVAWWSMGRDYLFVMHQDVRFSLDLPRASQQELYNAHRMTASPDVLAKAVNWNSAASRFDRLRKKKGRFNRRDLQSLATATVDRWYKQNKLETRAKARAVRTWLAGYLINNPKQPIPKGVPNDSSNAAKLFDLSKRDQKALQYAEQNAVQHVRDMQQNSKQALRDVVSNSIKNKQHPKETAKEMLDKFGTLNRDWRRIAITETNGAYHGGMLGALIGQKVVWVAASDACEHCKRHHNHEFLVVSPDEPSKNWDTQLWAGKSNVGRSFSRRARDGHIRSDDEMAKPTIPMHPHCYHKDVEVYTDEGWKLFPDLHGKEKILSINPENDEIEFVEYVEFVGYRYKGDMLHFHSRSYDLTVTPDHSMWIKRRYGKDRQIISELMKAEEVLKLSEFRLPRVGSWFGDESKTISINGHEIDSSLFVEFMGYYLADGSISMLANKSYKQVKITKQTGELQDKIVTCLTAMGIKCWQGKSGIFLPDLPWLSMYLDKLGKAATKYIPKELKALSKEHCNILVNAFIDCDGHRRIRKKMGNTSSEITLSTTSSRLAGDLGELIIKAGGYPAFEFRKQKGKQIEFDNGTYTLNHDLWVIRWNTQANSSYRRNVKSGLKFEKIPYDDMVYDVELERNHVLLVRQNGKTSWSGNCRCRVRPTMTVSRGMDANLRKYIQKQLAS